MKLIANPAKPAHFLPIYREFFDGVPYPFTMLEIGVHTGGSMRLWREWFPDCRIVGLDHDLSQSGPIEGVTLWEGKQGDLAVLADLVEQFGGFDVVIDDGSHVWADQLASLVALWKHTRSWYAIEDIQTSYSGLIEGDDGHWAGGMSTVAHLKDRVDAIQYHGTGSLHFYPGLAVMVR